MTSHTEPHAFGATDVLLLVMAVIWGVNFSVIKFGLGVFPPLAFNALRVSVASVALAALAFAPGANLPSMADRRRLMALGLLGHSVYQLLFMNGLSRARAGTVALVIGGTPAIIAILGRAFGFDRIHRRGAFGIATSILGVLLVVIGASTSGNHDDSLFGIALILASSVCWSLYVMGLRTVHHVDGVQIAAWTLFGGALPLIISGLPALSRIDLARVPAGAWGSIAYSGLMAFVLAYLFWYRGMKRLGPTRTSMYANLQPIIALAAAWITLHETPTPWQFGGAACVITGLYLTRT
ncbi:MAG TPA: EamA family transporter [Gemmatimonadaceae bacterium]|nr:EamA family transporter [Gemmatimonadaceae bacterium]